MAREGRGTDQASLPVRLAYSVDPVARLELQVQVPLDFRAQESYTVNIEGFSKVAKRNDLERDFHPRPYLTHRPFKGLERKPPPVRGFVRGRRRLSHGVYPPSNMKPGDGG
jgi:hypothetical protein